MEKNEIEIHGHRGARGYFPENTLTGFIESAKMDVHWIEMDVVISEDKKVVVSHEPWMSSTFCSMPDGTAVKKSRKFNLYKMNYEEIKKFDCGIRTNPKFPEQKSVPSYKPLLAEVIDAMSSLFLTSREKTKAVKYSIEIKCMKNSDKKYHPKPEEFSELVYNIICEKKISDKVLVQSFDTRVLKWYHKNDNSIKTGLLLSDSLSVRANVKKLGFVPHAYNPYFKLATKKVIDHAHELGMKVIVWTANTSDEIKRMIKNGVDGIVTDYPDVAFDCIYTLSEKQIKR